MIIKWLLRLATWDGLLPVAIWSLPYVAGFVVPKNWHALELLAIVLPIIAFIVRYRVGKRYILTNRCGDAFRFVQAISLCLGIFLMVFIDAMLVIFSMLPAGADVTITDGLVFLVLYTTYLSLMGVALYPGINGRKGRELLDWLSAPVICNGDVVCEPLLPDELSDFDLPSICLRMHLIMASIEHDRCEGRLLPTDLFDSIDDLENALRHETDNSVADWTDLIGEFGTYYHLASDEPIHINPRFYPDLKRRFEEVHEDNVTISHEQDRELKRRIAAHDADPNSAITREELERRLSERG